MSELIAEVVADPGRLTELNEQFSRSPELCAAWLGQLLSFSDLSCWSSEFFVSQVMQVGQTVLRSRIQAPSAFPQLTAAFEQLCELLCGFQPLLVFARLVEAGCSQRVDFSDCYFILIKIVQKRPQLKQILLQAVNLIADQLLEQLQLQKALFSSNFARSCRANKDLSQATQLLQFLQLCARLFLENGLQLSVFELLIRLLAAIDAIKQFTLVPTNTNQNNSQMIQPLSVEITNSVVNSLKAFDEVFHKQALQIELQQETQQNGVNLLDGEFQAFLEKHPGFLLYYQNQLTQLLDNGLDVILTSLQQLESEEMLQSCVLTVFNRVLQQKTTVVQFIVFPVLEIPSIQLQVINILFTTAFANPTVSWDVAQSAAEYLMSLTARCASFQSHLLLQIIQVLLTYIFQMDQIIQVELKNDAQQLRLALAVKSVLYLFVFLHGELDWTSVTEQIGKLTLLRNRAIFALFPHVLDEFVNALWNAQLLHPSVLDLFNQIRIGANEAQNGAEQLQNHFPFEPPELELSFERWIQPQFRVLQDFQQ